MGSRVVFLAERADSEQHGGKPLHSIFLLDTYGNAYILLKITDLLLAWLFHAERGDLSPAVTVTADALCLRALVPNSGSEGQDYAGFD